MIADWNTNYYCQGENNETVGNFNDEAMKTFGSREQVSVDVRGYEKKKIHMNWVLTSLSSTVFFFKQRTKPKNLVRQIQRSNEIFKKKVIQPEILMKH